MIRKLHAIRTQSYLLGIDNGRGLLRLRCPPSRVIGRNPRARITENGIALAPVARTSSTAECPAR